MSSDNNRSPGGISRRKFLKGTGVAAVGSVAAGGLLSGSAGDKPNPDVRILGPDASPLRFTVNGKPMSTKAEPRETLAEVLRNHFHLTGTKTSCDRGACGACTVLLDGEPVNSCMTLAHDCAGRSVETIEGLMSGDELHAIQQAFIDHDGMQCGFCTPGMIMSSKAFLDKHPEPSEDEIRNAVSGNLCRCGTYPKVLEAALAAAHTKGGKG